VNRIIVRMASPPRKRASPFIRVRHSPALHQRTLEVLTMVEAADDPTLHREAFASVIIELTDNALDYCFVQPLKRAKPGFVVEQTAGLGLVGVQQIIGPVVRQVIGHMDGPRLLSISASIRQFMV
jgi:hypothetical protein